MLTLLGATIFAALTTEILPVGLLSEMGADLGVPESRVGLLVSVYAVVVVVGSIPLTALLVRWPRRTALVAVLLTYAVSNLLVASAAGFWATLVARVLGGLAHAGVFSIVVALAVTAARPEQAGRAIAYVNAGNALALSFGVPLGTFLGTAVGWRWAFTLAGAGLLVLALGAARMLPAAPAPSAAGPALSIGAALRRPALLVVAVTIMVFTLGHYTAYTYISPLLRNAGVPEAALGAALLAYGVGSLLGLSAAAALADRRLRPGLTGAFALTVAALVALGGPASSPWAATAAVFAWGVAFGALPTLLQTAALHATPGSPDLAPSVVNSSWNVGIASGGLLGGRVLEAAAPPAVAYAGAGLAAVGLALLVAPAARRRTGQRVAATR
nr:MFS transporter [Motilibacter aurantiacus]